MQTSNNLESSHEYGVAFTIPQSQKIPDSEGKPKTVNFSVSYDTLFPSSLSLDESYGEVYSDCHPNVIEELEELEEEQILLSLIKKADIDGLGRLYLSLPEFFSKEELHLMQKHTER